jgi:hypothetical protein
VDIEYDTYCQIRNSIVYKKPLNGLIGHDKVVVGQEPCAPDILRKNVRTIKVLTYFWKKPTASGGVPCMMNEAGDTCATCSRH